MKNLTTRVPNYTQINFPYSTVTSACQGSWLACTRTVSIFRTKTKTNHLPKPKQTILHSYRNEINTVNQLQLVYQRKSIDTATYESLCVITIKLSTLTDVPYQVMVGGAFVYVCENS